MNKIEKGNISARETSKSEDFYFPGPIAYEEEGEDNYAYHQKICYKMKIKLLKI